MRLCWVRRSPLGDQSQDYKPNTTEYLRLFTLKVLLYLLLQTSLDVFVFVDRSNTADSHA